jgi:hypothetical protein
MKNTVVGGRYSAVTVPVNHSIAQETDAWLCFGTVAIHVTSHRKAYIWEGKPSGKPERVWRIGPEGLAGNRTWDTSAVAWILPRYLHWNINVITCIGKDEGRSKASNISHLSQWPQHYTALLVSSVYVPTLLVIIGVMPDTRYWPRESVSEFIVLYRSLPCLYKA